MILWQGCLNPFASFPERIVEYMYTHDKAAFDKLRDSIMDAFVPNVIPTVAAPFIEAWSNRSLFTVRQIIPEARKHMLPQHQYTPHGTELAKAVSAGVARTPEWLESVPGVAQFRKMAASPALAENLYKMLVNQGKRQEAAQLLKDNGGVLLNTDPMRTKLMEMHKHVDSIYNSKVMVPDVKRQKIDAAYQQMDMMAKRFNEVIKRAQEQKATAG
ncbi:MAG: hypothetical protein HQL05_14985 [Nitrospirae bacterium]|nr:hypothetical protein [Nitrospirota bacterium]